MTHPSPAYEGHTGRIGLGDHVCQFFRTAHDLSQTLIPYFKTGLEQNEACVWVTAQPYPAERALSELRAAVPDADRLVAKGQLQIYSFDEWYLKYAELGLEDSCGYGWPAKRRRPLSATLAFASAATDRVRRQRSPDRLS